MIFFSELIGAKVKDLSNVAIGRLVDALIRPKPGEYSPIEYLVFKERKTGNRRYLTTAHTVSISPGSIHLKHVAAKLPMVTPPDDLICLARDILDQQIVDIEGVRVVRVNDLELGFVDSRLSLLGLDVSFRGVLRRLGMEWFDFAGVLQTRLIDWRKAQPVKGMLQLNTLSADLTKLHPADLANIIEDLSIAQGTTLVEKLESEHAAQVIEEMDPELQKGLVKYMGHKRVAKLIEHMSVDEVTDLLQMLSRKEKRALLAHMQADTARDVEKLIQYPDDTAGGLMTTQFVAVRPDWTVGQASEQVRAASDEMRSILHVYVVDDDNHLLGSVSLRWLLVSPPGEAVANIVKTHLPHATLRVDQDFEDIGRLMTKYNLFTAAVVDDDNHLVGVVTIDDVMRCLIPDA